MGRRPGSGAGRSFLNLSPGTLAKLCGAACPLSAGPRGGKCCGIDVAQTLPDRSTRRSGRALSTVHRLDDLRVPPNNRLELLTGDHAGPHRIRVNDPGRATSAPEPGSGWACSPTTKWLWFATDWLRNRTPSSPVGLRWRPEIRTCTGETAAPIRRRSQSSMSCTESAMPSTSSGPFRTQSAGRRMSLLARAKWPRARNGRVVP